MQAYTRVQEWKEFVSLTPLKSLGLHLFTIPYTPQLNAIEMVLSQLKSSVVPGFTGNPERRKDLPRVIDGAMGSVSSKDIENHSRHQAKVVAQCLREFPLSR